MKQTLIAFAVAAGCAFAGTAGAAGAAMTKEAYKAQMDKIEADYKAASDSCKALKANAQDICKAEAKGKEKIAKAELEASNAPSPSADQKLRMAKADATYEIAKERCDDLTGNAKDVCMEEAKGKEKVAKAELEFNYTGKPNDQNKVLVVKADAAYEVAKEKCDEKAGNDKDVCVKEAKAAKAKAVADAKMSK